MFPPICFTTPERDYSKMTLDQLLENVLSDSHFSFQGNNTEKNCRNELGQRIKKHPKNWKQMDTICEELMKAATHWDWVVRERAYITLNVVIENAPKNYGSFPGEKGRALVLCIAQAVETEFESDRMSGNKGSYESRIPKMGAARLEEMGKKWPKLFNVSLLLSLVSIGKKTMCQHLVQDESSLQELIKNQERQKRIVSPVVADLPVYKM